MTSDLNYIINFVTEALLKTWPYLLLSIPLAVAVRVSDASRYIRKAFVSNEVLAIVLAVGIGAFSPFCSCGVIPIVTSLLIASVPLAPVMAFWIASPTMDPEIFLLSVGILGWELAVARLVATLVLSLSAGFITSALARKGFFAEGILREQQRDTKRTLRQLMRGGAIRLREILPTTANDIVIGSDTLAISLSHAAVDNPSATQCGECSTNAIEEPSCESNACATKSPQNPSKAAHILSEGLSATWMIVQFMLIAYTLEALITLYVPQELIVSVLGSQNPLVIAGAGLIGLPVYTSNLTALPLVAGPVTTIPAMTAVYGIAKRRIFIVYVTIGLVGAVLLGYIYQLIMIT